VALIEVEGGNLKTVGGDKDNPDSQRLLCVRGRARKRDPRQSKTTPVSPNP
jgi:hypothetical protein